MTKKYTLPERTAYRFCAEGIITFDEATEWIHELHLLQELEYGKRTPSWGYA